MQNENLTVLHYVSEQPNGKILKRDLYARFPDKIRQISSLTTGNRPNMFLDNDGFYQITQRGFIAICESGLYTSTVRLDIATLPNYTRNALSGSRHRERNARRIQTENGNAQNMIEIEIDRNDYVKITCKVHERFKAWVKENGRLRSLLDDLGSGAVNNWDATQETKYYSVNLGNIDALGSGTSNIVTSSGINPLIIKLACASENNTYTVKYRGLVAWETVQANSTRLADECIRFYKQYVKPCNYKIAVQFFI